MVTDNLERSETFVRLSTTDSLDELFLRSNRVPVILFKHSTTCPISGAAYHEMEQLGREVALVVIQDSPDISKEIERRTRVRHESPQVILVRNGVVAWSASHWAIKADAVERAVSAS